MSRSSGDARNFDSAGEENRLLTSDEWRTLIAIAGSIHFYAYWHHRSLHFHLAFYMTEETIISIEFEPERIVYI